VAEAVGEWTTEKLGTILRAGAPVLLIRAGAWLVRPAGFGFPRFERDKTGVVRAAWALLRIPGGCGLSIPEPDAGWRELLSKTGGDFSRLSNFAEALPQACLPDTLLCTWMHSRARYLAEENNLSPERILRIRPRKLRSFTSPRWMS